MQLWRSAVVLVVGQIGPVTIGDSVKNSKNLQQEKRNVRSTKFNIILSHPAGYSGVAEVRSVISLGGGAPAEPGEDDDEGDEVEEGGHCRVDHLHLEEGEGQLDLDVVLDPEQVEEGPEDRDNEAGHHHEEEPVIVTHAEGKFCSVEGDVDGGGGAGHAHHTQDLKERGFEFCGHLYICVTFRQN